MSSPKQYTKPEIWLVDIHPQRAVNAPIGSSCDPGQGEADSSPFHIVGDWEDFEL